eukprot:15013-Heterococcus_DN1.PRE.2
MTHTSHSVSVLRTARMTLCLLSTSTDADVVIRQWHARTDTIANTVNALLQGAQDAADACRNGDLQTLGATLSHYYELKKVMAGDGAEPTYVRYATLTTTVHCNTMTGVMLHSFKVLCTVQCMTGNSAT